MAPLPPPGYAYGFSFVCMIVSFYFSRVPSHYVVNV